MINGRLWCSLTRVFFRLTMDVKDFGNEMNRALGHLCAHIG